MNLMNVRQPAEVAKAFEAGDLGLVHWSWTMTCPDGRTAEGTAAEVLRGSTDGVWTYVVDDPAGSAWIGHP